MVSKNIDTDYLIALNTSGLTGKQIADELGISETHVSRLLREAGIKRTRRKPLPVDFIVAQYKSGVGTRTIANILGTHPRIINERLREAGVPIRSRSESMRIRMGRTSPAERERLTRAARAVPGSPGSGASLPPETQHAIALAHERRKHPYRISPNERRLSELLAERGDFGTVPQKAFGPYNCDLALTAYSVAVEVFGGHWHWHGDHLARMEKRSRYILDAGWHLLVIWATKAFPISPAAADYVADFCHTVGRDKPATRQYRMIRGTGELESSGSVNDDQIAIVCATTLARDPTSGRYYSVRR